MVYNIKLGPMINISFGVTLSLMMGMGVISWKATQQLNETNRWVSHTFEVIANLKGLEKAMVDVETGQRGFLVSNQEDFLEPYFQGQDAVEQLLLEVQTLTRDNPTQQENIAALEQLIDLTFQDLETGIQLRRSKQEAQLLERFQSQEGKQRMDQVRSAIAAMVEIEDNLLKERNAATLQISRFSTWVIIGGTSGAFALGLFVLFFLGHEVIQPINQVASHLGSSSREISVTVEQQEQAARNQAAIASQTSATMDELGASSRQSALQAETAVSGAQKALVLAEGGTKAVELTLQGMENLKDRVEIISAQIQRLSEQTTQIGSISGLVSDLANQTNMLALNAAVEAVRAGEHGKGFAVVSGEIRKLADQSKTSAARINALVHEIQQAIESTVVAADEGTKTVEAGVRIATETAQAFVGVTDSVNNVVLSNRQISLNVKEQATAIQQVLLAMSSLAQTAQDNASGIVQVKEGTHRLNDAATQLTAIV